MDVAASSEGGRAMAPTSLDAEHGPHQMIDGRPDTFWMSTGLFPQEVVIKLAEPTELSQIKLCCTNVQKVCFMGSADSATPAAWETLGDLELPDTDGRLQRETCSLDPSGREVQFLKVRLLQGWDDFCSVHSLEALRVN